MSVASACPNGDTQALAEYMVTVPAISFLWLGIRFLTRIRVSLLNTEHGSSFTQSEKVHPVQCLVPEQ